jgi:hypothetical protein
MLAAWNFIDDTGELVHGLLEFQKYGHFSSNKRAAVGN